MEDLHNKINIPSFFLFPLLFSGCLSKWFPPLLFNLELINFVSWKKNITQGTAFNKYWKVLGSIPKTTKEKKKPMS